MDFSDITIIISNITIVLFAFSVFCGILNLFIAFITRKNSTDYMFKTKNVLQKLFIIPNLPLGIIAISLCTVNVLHYGEENTGFLICLIIFIFSLISECLLDKLSLPDRAIKSVHNDPNPIFAMMDLMNDMAKQKICLLSAINEYNSSLLENTRSTHNIIVETDNSLNDFISCEKQKNEGLGARIQICNQIFTQLANAADSANKNVESLNQKLASSVTALTAVENQDKMLKDTNMTFTRIFNEQSIDVNSRIQRILDNLGNITLKCANLQNFPKPYKEIIDLYGSKIETVFSVLDKRMLKFIWEEHILAGKASVYSEPQKTISEMDEAIKINPENADMYYFKGMAYQLKRNPDYEAAMKNFEKALELKPKSYLYSKCIEELKAKINET